MPRSSSSARWTYAVAGGLLALAMVAAVFMLFDPTGGDQGDDRTPVSATPIAPAPSPLDDKRKRTDKATKNPDRKASPTARPSREPQPSQEPQPTGGEGVAAVYYVGETSAGPRLFREFRTIRGAGGLDRAINGLQGAALDPDYVRTWSPGSVQGADYLGNGDTGLVRVSLTSANLRRVPDGMSRAQGLAAVQSLVYTVQGAVQARAAVEFVLDGQPVDRVYGVDTSAPLVNAAVLSTLNPMSITTPEQGSTQSGVMKISGVGNSFEASVGWQIQDADGHVVKRGSSTSEGWTGDQLYPWSGRVNLAELPAGDYLFTASTDDPTAGTEGFGPAVDTKGFTIG